MIRLYAALGALAALLGAIWWVHHEGYASGAEDGRAAVQAVFDKYKLDQQKAYAALQATLDTAAAQYEIDKAQQRTRIVTVTKEVTREIDKAPAWRDAPIPDGVRDSILAAATFGAQGAGQPDRAVPAAGSAAASNERGSGLDFDRVARRLGRLQGAASAPR